MNPRKLLGGPAIVAYLALVKLLVHLGTARVYGFFTDELYFLACGEHLDWGYVDMPPLTAFQAWLTRALFGDAPESIRLFPALAGAALVLLTGALVRALGGGRFAQGLTALAVVIAPVYLAFDSYLSMNSIEPLLWMGCAWVLIRMIQTGEVRLWLAFGALAGIGLENKHTMLLFGFALVAGLLLTPERRLLANRWLPLGGLIAFNLFLPNLLWNLAHHFPFFELLRNIREDGRDVQFSPLQFLALQAVLVFPLSFPLWTGGLLRLLANREARPYRALGWAYLIALGVLLLTHGKVYYLAPAYSMLLAAGAVSLEERLRRLRSLRTPAPRAERWLKPALATGLLLTGALFAPTALPILPPETYLRYTEALGIAQPKIENRGTGPMPQLFADRFGWKEMAETVARVYHALPEGERQRTAIYANDYGEGGAIDYYGPTLGLPKAIGGHVSYWLWGPRAYTGETLIVLGDDSEGIDRHFEEVHEVAEIGHPYAMRQEHFTLYLCRKPKGWRSLQEIWPRLKEFH